MRIVKIEIDGFKSYGQYQSLERLDAQFNAITGLNGSGKSNILDSICFLLGISHLQYIRAENTEELVFKKGQGGITKATVTITFDNSDAKHCPIGYENDKVIVVRRQIVLNGKETYHINNMSASKTKVSDMFNACSMNVNNPHFLIMQGRVTKVLNMKPREILLMIEEAAGVRVYENKRRTALTTIDKKGQKIDNMNKMMDEEILPRLNKLRGERELYNEYLKLGRDIEAQERLHHCLEFYSADHMAKRLAESIEQLVLENQESKEEIKQLDAQIVSESEILKEMLSNRDVELTVRKEHLNESKSIQETALAGQETELAKAEDELKELNSKIDETKRGVATDKERLKKKKLDFNKAQEEHGGEARQFEEAKKLKVACEATLSALDRGLVTDDAGNEVSMQEQISDLRSKLNAKESEARRYKANLDAFRPDLAKNEHEYSSLATRRSSNSLELQANKHRQDIAKLEADIEKFGNVNRDREQLTGQRNQLYTDMRQQKDKEHDIYNRYPFLNFKYRTPPNFDQNDVVGPFVKLIRLRNPEYAPALEIALGGIITNVVVRTREAAKRLLSHGQLERRVTFIPLDNLNYRPMDPRQFERAKTLVGADNVFRAMDLVDYDDSNRQAIEYALGNILVCKTPDAAKEVCFDRNIRLRVVTFDGDDYRPDGFLTGGSNQRKTSCLLDLNIVENLDNRIAKTEDDIRNLDARLAELARNKNDCDQLIEARDNIKFELRDIEDQIRLDPTSKLRDRIQKLKRDVEDNETKLSELQPIINQMSANLKEIEDRQRNEVAYRNTERKKAEDGLRKADNTLRRLKDNSENAIQQLEIHQLDVQTLKNQIQSDEDGLSERVRERQTFIGQRDEILRAVLELKRQVDQIRQEYSEFMGEFRAAEQEIRQKTDFIEQLRRNIREKKAAQETFEPTRRDLSRKVGECSRQAEIIEQQYSWITEEKEHFNKPGTAYDFRNTTSRDIQQQIRDMKDRREELDRRVNVNAMKALGEEEERANDLDIKRKALENDRELLHKTIFEIDAEKKRELENAYRKISVDFGSIFSTILPGVTAKLQAVDENELTNGLQIRVAFNNQWKESLDELSGGQRSLVALSLILAMLKCRPAPIYILDEVDAALDLSHTANIGTMIKQHFKESQFIIVSLKEGMFNNANVIYRTQFVNGTSKVSRTENKN